MLQSELHSSSILEAKLSPSNQPLFIIVHEENGLLAQLQIRITDGTQHWSGHIVADDIQASNDEMRTQKFALTRTALKAPTNELALHCDLQPSSNSLKILVKQRVQNSNVQKQISSLLIPRTSDEISLFRILSASNVQLNRNVAQLQDHNLKLESSLRETRVTAEALQNQLQTRENELYNNFKYVLQAKKEEIRKLKLRPSNVGSGGKWEWDW